MTRENLSNVITFVTFPLAIAWFFSDPGFEPVIVAIGVLGTLFTVNRIADNSQKNTVIEKPTQPAPPKPKPWIPPILKPIHERETLPADILSSPHKKHVISHISQIEAILKWVRNQNPQEMWRIGEFELRLTNGRNGRGFLAKAKKLQLQRGQVQEFTNQGWEVDQLNPPQLIYEVQKRWSLKEDPKRIARHLVKAHEILLIKLRKFEAEALNVE
ncbi:MAG: hypothetical protein MUF87_10790 [Anaerolineae bacterium]|jgi:hypothetical protein|nr:hypothetical protein [Anaerolineae bacterium]